MGDIQITSRKKKKPIWSYGTQVLVSLNDWLAGYRLYHLRFFRLQKGMFYIEVHSNKWVIYCDICHQKLFIDRPYKSIGSSEPTYESWSDDWFKTHPSLVLWNVSITSTVYTLLWDRFSLDGFSPYLVTFWVSTRSWFCCPILRAQP